MKHSRRFSGGDSKLENIKKNIEYFSKLCLLPVIENV